MTLTVVLSNGKRFVTDFGASLTAVAGNGEEFHIPRYGVWHCAADHKPFVVYTTDDLIQAEEIMDQVVPKGELKWRTQPTTSKPRKN